MEMERNSSFSNKRDNLFNIHFWLCLYYFLSFQTATFLEIGGVFADSNLTDFLNLVFSEKLRGIPSVNGKYYTADEWASVRPYPPQGETPKSRQMGYF